ncbi:hypothetical protein SMC26_08000 [Actinomadura fulvescens]|uniref:Uncharacterized protein n=1 Tax=Actinomadura fulvescens TaxID=46160 RepID=A0ABP6D6K0_9ACTN
MGSCPCPRRPGPTTHGEQIFLAVCRDTTPAGEPGVDEPGRHRPHTLGPPFRNQAIARLWLSNYLAASADSLELDGDHDGTAAAYREAVPQMRKHGHATIGTVCYEVIAKD